MSDSILDLNDLAPPRLRARAIAVTFTVEVVADDGEQLHPIETRPMRLPASDWQHWHLDIALAQIQEQLDQR